MRKILIALFLTTVVAQAQWLTPPWPSTSYPREGADHTINSYEAARERACGCRVQTGGILTGEDWYPTYATDTYMWDTFWALGFFGGFSMVDLYRSQRDMLVNEKYMITNEIPYYLDTTEATTNETSSLSFTEYLNANSGQFPFLNISNVLERAGAPANYFTSTPYRALFDSEYGWKYIPAIQNQLIATVEDVSWTNTVECSNLFEYDWGASVIQTNITNYVTASFYDIAPPSDHYSWWLFTNQSVCPYLASTWPTVDWSTIGCAPSSPVSNAAPIFTGYLTSDIDFKQSAYYYLESSGDRHTGDWRIELYSGVSTQNTYEVGGTVRAADPVVTNTCIKLAKTVQFYAKYQKERYSYATDWYLLETVTGTTNHYVKGSQFDPSHSLSNAIEVATGSCDSCWATSTNLIESSSIIISSQRISGPAGAPCEPGVDLYSCWDGPRNTYNVSCVWTNLGTVVTSVYQVIEIDYLGEATYNFEVDGANLTYTNQPEFRAVVWWDVPDGFAYTNGASSL